jgi:FixJ family two-component response regulator
MMMNRCLKRFPGISSLPVTSPRRSDHPLIFLNRAVYPGAGCILLDLMMQQMNGLEFQQILRACDISLPVIFLSGHGTVPAASAAFKGGAVDS